MLLSLCQSFVVFCTHCCGKGILWSCNANKCCRLQPAFVRQCSCLVWQCYLVTVVDGMAILIVVAARIGVWQCSQYCGFANGIVPYLRFACKKKNLQVPLANNHSVWCVCVYVVCVCARVRVCVCSMYYTVDLTFVPMRCKNISTQHTRHASSRPTVYPILCQVDYMPPVEDKAWKHDQKKHTASDGISLGWGLDDTISVWLWGCSSSTCTDRIVTHQGRWKSHKEGICLSEVC